MPIDPNDAINRALDHFAKEYRDSLSIREAQSSDHHPYGFDPDGWALFVISESRGVGASNYVGVNMESGETKSFGAIGD